ncbi:MAG: hydrolase [Planctomycetota bacterium]|nr:MAG: hydrolase [Planctomycetota bacterium]
MNAEPTYPRSPELMSPQDTALVVVDVQGKLVRLIAGHERMLWNLRRLLDAAEATGVAVLATEQYPQGLGPTVPELAERLGDIPSKTAFSCAGCEPFMARLEALGVSKVLVSGIEAHVCVQQTVLDLLAGGYRVYVPVDAVGSRFGIDFETGLKRMESSGATLTTTESALFEWCQDSSVPAFKKISALVREQPPAA